MLGLRLSTTPVVLVLVIAAAPGCFLDGTAFETSGAGAAAGAPGMGGSAGDVGGSGGAVGGTSSAGGTGGAIQPQLEDCTNGVDDDRDGEADCADTDACSALVACETAA